MSKPAVAASKVWMSLQIASHARVRERGERGRADAERDCPCSQVMGRTGRQRDKSGEVKGTVGEKSLRDQTWSGHGIRYHALLEMEKCLLTRQTSLEAALECSSFRHQMVRTGERGTMYPSRTLATASSGTNERATCEGRVGSRGRDWSLTADTAENQDLSAMELVQEACDKVVVVVCQYLRHVHWSELA